jgi:hypothetical protein
MRGFFLPGPAGSRPEHLQRKKRGRLAITLFSKKTAMLSGREMVLPRNGATT